MSHAQTETHIRKKMEITGGISPKSVVISSTGMVAAQNMMYRHCVTLYDANGEQLHKIKDAVNLKRYGHRNYSDETVRGAPVEGAFTSDGQSLWISNYAMEGSDFNKTGCDDCIGQAYDAGFLYKINCATGKIENVVAVGSVPKHLIISSNDSLLLVSNWVSSDVSIIDLAQEKEIKRIHVGPHPRGIALREDAKKAYVALMGSSKIAVLDLENDSVSYLQHIGKAPRSLILADNDSTLYISLNSENKVKKLELYSQKAQTCTTSSGPRSMTLSPDGESLYVVNYFDDQFTKIRTDSMKIEAVVPTAPKPIGICANWEQGEIWVACYTGKIEIFRDFTLKSPHDNWLKTGLSYLDFGNRSALKPSAIIDNDTIKPPKKMISDSVSTVLLDGKKASPHSLAVHTFAQQRTTCRFHIIVGAFHVYENAVKKENALRNAGYQAALLSGKYHYVSISCVATKTAAEAEKKRIQSLNDEWRSAWVLESQINASTLD